MYNGMMQFGQSTKTKAPAFDISLQENGGFKEAAGLIPPDIIEDLGAFAFEKNGNTIKIAAKNPNDASLKEYCSVKFPGTAIEWFKATDDELKNFLNKLDRDYRTEISRIIDDGKSENGNTVRLVDLLILYALKEKASDIHIEPLRNETVVRFRVDGVLHQVISMSKDFHTPLVARFKILSNMKIDEYRRPQDGRIEPENIPDTSIRISTAPTLHGEKIALRILDDSHKNFAIDTLGFSRAQGEILERNIEKPFGMIVTSGPTGSGKTTTLYGLLNLLKKDGINISTLEDPIEYGLQGVNQIQINPRVDLTFASGLKSLLRQDPDVIMVGEIRDTDTVVMAANAALTGHLVLTTIHTNDAPSVFTRFLEMRVEDFLVASIVNLVIAQRLLRRVCGVCAEERTIDEAVLKKIGERKDVVKILEKNGVSAANLASRKFRIGKGCKTCIQTGYSGRIGMFELLELNKEIHGLILEHAPAEKIKQAAEKSGFREMLYDGIEKVLAGITTFEEVLRTTRNA